MIHTQHLIWIIRLFASFGFMLGAIMAVGKKSDNEPRGEGET